MAARRLAMAMAMAMASLMMVMAAADAKATTIQFVNQCEDAVTWYDGSDSLEIATDAVYTTQLTAGDNAAYRAGVTNDATLAEFAVDESNTWYDISIIPAGPLGGPGSCSSLEECKQVTGGEGFNVAMRIVPSRSGAASTSVCRTLSCLEDGCDDAYQYPDQAAKTHNCAAGISFEVIFCPSDTSSSSSLASGSNSSDWIPLDSVSGSGDATADADVAVFNASSVASDAEAKTNTRSGTAASSSSRSESEQQVGNNSSNNAADSSSSAVIVAAALGATAVVIVLGTVVARHWRTLALKWEAAHWHKPRTSSPTLSFVEIDDAASP